MVPDQIEQGGEQILLPSDRWCILEVEGRRTHGGGDSAVGVGYLFFEVAPGNEEMQVGAPGPNVFCTESRQNRVEVCIQRFGVHIGTPKGCRGRLAGTHPPDTLEQHAGNVRVLDHGREGFAMLGGKAKLDRDGLGKDVFAAKIGRSVRAGGDSVTLVSGAGRGLEENPGDEAEGLASKGRGAHRLYDMDAILRQTYYLLGLVLLSFGDHAFVVKDLEAPFGIARVGLDAGRGIQTEGRLGIVGGDAEVLESRLDDGLRGALPGPSRGVAPGLRPLASRLSLFFPGCAVQFGFHEIRRQYKDSLTIATHT